MTNDEVKIGRVYAVKIGKNTIGVRIMGQTPDGGYNAVNVNTDKIICIKSAQRLCGLYNPKAADKTATAAQGAAKDAEPSNDAATPKTATQTKRGGLTAAATVLAEAGIPLNCQEMVKRMLEKGYWKTDGRTPSATIYSAIAREIKEKSDDARFRKTGRGKFMLAK
jgi:hypothetical protein